MTSQPFVSERQLYRAVVRSRYFRKIKFQLKPIVLKEPQGLSGIPDLMLALLNRKDMSTAVMAIELKLSNWRRALFQAFRYRSFAEISIVVLDHARVAPALRNIDRFQNANIGLMSIDRPGKIYIHFRPTSETPYTVFLSTSIKSYLAALFSKHEGEPKVLSSPRIPRI